MDFLEHANRGGATGASCKLIDIVKGKSAFTLAEVLITLAIIGLVAALTIPTLIQSYKKQVVLTQLKKAYSEVKQALQLAEADYGSHQYWDYGNDFDGDSAVKFVDTYIAPYLKLSKNCGKNTGCLNGKIYSLDDRVVTAAGDDNTRCAKAVTASGYAIAVTSGAYYVTIRLIIDNKEKLILGKNVFDFPVSSKSVTMMGLNGIVSREDDLLNEPRYGCSKVGGDSSGMRCGRLIMFDGWKISEDYPIKF